MDNPKTHKTTTKYVQQELFSAPPDNKVGFNKTAQTIIRYKRDIKTIFPFGPTDFYVHMDETGSVIKLQSDLILQFRQDANAIISASEPPQKPKSSTRSATVKPYEKLLRIWELFPFILSTKTKREVYEPAYNDLLADYLKAMPFKTKWAKRWLAFSFTCRTAYMVFDCLRVMAGTKLKNVIWRSITESFRTLNGG